VGAKLIHAGRVPAHAQLPPQPYHARQIPHVHSLSVSLAPPHPLPLPFPIPRPYLTSSPICLGFPYPLTFQRGDEGPDRLVAPTGVRGPDRRRRRLGHHDLLRGAGPGTVRDTGEGASSPDAAYVHARERLRAAGAAGRICEFP